MAIRLRNGHTHVFERITSVDLDHVHNVVTTSDRAVVLCNGRHVHRIRTLTTFDREHAHAVWTRTGAGIPIGNGHHVHRVRARTTLVRAHRHRVMGHTQGAPNIPRPLVRKVIRRHCRDRNC